MYASLARKQTQVPRHVADLHLPEAALLGGRKLAHVPSQLGHRPEPFTVLLELAREFGKDWRRSELVELGPFMLARRCTAAQFNLVKAAERDLGGGYFTRGHVFQYVTGCTLPLAPVNTPNDVRPRRAARR